MRKRTYIELYVVVSVVVVVCVGVFNNSEMCCRVKPFCATRIRAVERTWARMAPALLQTSSRENEISVFKLGRHTDINQYNVTDIETSIGELLNCTSITYRLTITKSGRHETCVVHRR